MKLPNGEHAIVDIDKLRDYCLSNTHLRGQHKARVFASALGLNVGDAEYLQSAILNAAMNIEAIPTKIDAYGQRFVVDFSMEGDTGTAFVRSIWIIKSGESYPRLTTCYVL